MTTCTPMVSVVIPAHNAQSHLPECLASVIRQAGDFMLEIIVVDDGSTDATADIARQWENIKCLTQCNRGPSAARNTGIAEAQGEFIALLDADDLWPAGKLAAQLRVLQQHPEAAMVFGDCRQFDDGGPWLRTQFERGGLGHAAWGPVPVLHDAYPRLLRDNFITTGSVVLRRAVLTEVGGFAEDLRLVEDLDLWLRIAGGYPIAWCGDVCLLRRRHAANTSRDPQAMGLAFIEVLHRQIGSDRSQTDTLARTLNRLVANEYFHLCELALGQGQLSLGIRRAWQGLGTRPGPQSLWCIGKAAARLLASRRGRARQRRTDG
mgnify:FL=1